MGKIKGGRLSGAAGNLVFYSYNDTEYFRMLPRKRSKNGWSERQVLNRKRLSALSTFWRLTVPEQVKQIWKVAIEGKRGNNLFLRTNSPAFGADGALVDPERLHFSAGQLPLPNKMTASRQTGDPEKLEVAWEYDPKKGSARPDDELMMMVLNDGKFIGPVATGVIRKQESAVIQLPTVTGMIQGIYLFFGSKKRKLYSGDIYFGI